MSSQKYYYYRRLTYLIGDPHVWSETRRDMFYLRPIGELHASSETDMPHWRPTCLIEDPLETNMPHRRPIRNTYLAQGQSPIKHVGLRWGMSVTDGSPIRHVSLQWVSQSGMLVSNQACQSPIRHLGLWWVSVQACWSLMGLRWGMMFSDGSPIRHVGLRWVSCQACWSPMGLW